MLANTNIHYSPQLPIIAAVAILRSDEAEQFDNFFLRIFKSDRVVEGDDTGVRGGKNTLNWRRLKETRCLLLSLTSHLHTQTQIMFIHLHTKMHSNSEVSQYSLHVQLLYHVF